ncbi:MAG: SufS family cysteine desulfurase [Kofleriaceae bacterium]
MSTEPELRSPEALRALRALRADFPALATRVRGHRLAYLDSAATSLRPRAVIDAVSDVAITRAGSVHRGVHALSEAATDAFDEVRADVAVLLGAATEEVVFTSGTTASINLVAQSWGRRFVGAGDAIVVSELEHHANLVPWQLLCEERGAELRVVEIDARGRISLDDLDRKLDRKVRLVAVSHLSNVLGTITPIAEVAARARAVGARLLVDGAQAIAHLPVDVAGLGCDFYAFSAHKALGPTGTGVLWGRRELLDAMPPWQAGGGMIAQVTYASARFLPPPHRFEAGTPNISGVIGLGAALRYLRALDRDALAAHEAALHRELCARLAAVPGVALLGEPEAAVASFTVERVHPHDVATLLDARGVAIRAGHHCAQPLHGRLGLIASCRASLGCYSGLDDVEQLIGALAHVREVFP